MKFRSVRQARGNSEFEERKCGMDTLKKYKELLKEIGKLESATSLLAWDERTYIPESAHEARAQVLGKLSKMAFELSVSDEMGQYLEELTKEEVFQSLSEKDRASVYWVNHDYNRFKAIPPDLFEQYTIDRSKSEFAWEKAKAESNFEMFRPHLEKMVDYARRFADIFGYEENPYDALIEDYEPGMTARELKEIIEPLRKDLVSFLQELLNEGEPPDTSFLQGHFPKEKQKELSTRALEAMHYDFKAGRLDVSAHPFTTKIGPGDVRITTRYIETELLLALFGSMHEGGHGLYDQGIDKDLTWTGIDTGASMGIHESQSRLWENYVGRSRAFWQFFYPQLQEVFPRFEEVPVESFYRAVNKVEPSLIRVEADELTYNLHIMLRFELEEGLVNGRVEVKDLPELWNDAMNRYLGVTPPDDAHGVLQDVHWSGGMIGYFPSYMLGNLYAAQIFAAAKREIPSLEEKIASGDLLTLREWLREKIHRFGRMYAPKDILEKATGEGPNPNYFLEYVRDKFSDVYRL